jgi:hypothetical protein
LNTEAKYEFNKCNNIKKALKAQVEKAINVPYLIGIHGHISGFTNITLIAMLTHLFNNYGAISVIQLQANDGEMLKEWDPNTPIELLFMQVEEAQEFADDRNPWYSNIQVLNKAYNLVFKTSPFKRVCCKWNTCPTNKKTWANFKTHFSTAQVVLQEEMDTEMAGYHGANAVMSQENLQHQTEAPANLTTAVTSNCQAFDILTSTNLQLNQTITELLKKTEVLETKINSIQKPNGRATKPPRNLLI